MDGTFRLSTSNGEITLGEADGDFRLKSSNGDITVTSAQGAFLLDTSNGSVRFQGELAGQSYNRFETSNGNIIVALEGEPPSVRLEASTSNGGIELERGVMVEGDLGTDRLRGVMGDGDASLELRTSNGTIRIE